MCGELSCKIIKGIESMTRIETFLVFTVTAFYFSIMFGSIRTDQLVSDTEFLRRGFK